MSASDIFKRPMLLAGDLFFDPLDANGNRTGIVGPVETVTIGFNQNTDTVEQQSFSRANWGSVRSSVTITGKAELSIEYQDITPEVFAQLTMGKLNVQNAGAGTVTDEAVTAKSGKWVDLAQRNLTAGSVVVTDTAGNTTYTENTDYEIEYTTGMLMALTGGAIADGDSLLVDYAHAALQSKRIQLATESQVRVWLKLVGKNLADKAQRPLVATFPQVSLRPDNEVPLKGEEYLTGTLAGIAELAAGETAVGYVEFFNE